MNKICIISGPTATGKTLASIEIAKKTSGEVVNFDSLNFYHEISIGTAKPSLMERSKAPHHLFDINSINDPLNAADFVRKALPVMRGIHERGKPIILVGGSGFYLQALVEGMWDSPKTPKEIQQRSDELYAKEGIQPFIEILKSHDPESFQRLHANDHYRIRRATEHFWTHRTPFSQAKINFQSKHNQDWNLYHAYLDIPKPDHWAIIEERSRKMIKDGLIEEVQGLLAKGFTGSEKPLQSIGYKETFDWLKGVYGEDKDAFIERLSINTRRLAKAQRTWFKKKEKIQYDIRHDLSKLLADINQFMDVE